MTVSSPDSLEQGQLTFHPATAPNGVGILLVPGGGYRFVDHAKEGVRTLAYLDSQGYDTWVLNYSTQTNAPTPLFDRPHREALAAVSAVRSEARVSKLGIWGYSAGGHLAAMTLTEPGIELDFGILGYPVITMDTTGTTHAGSRQNLIGADATPELEATMSPVQRVSPQTPPTFIFHTSNDPAVPVENALLFATALARNKVPFHLLVLPDGPHGINVPLEDPVRNWTPELERWMKSSI
ncbi:endo-1,4-beta-xylanase B [Microdochium bolleyi]|uniref:Endo-1,4-beta-xylanase B n=1 Tax=Microdochium bolleyi TaxID=196109 RepID=A0A136ITF3_9PEZI|nr:endo-1,4-beta-xylanase B [Microdochium bolleyi]